MREPKIGDLYKPREPVWPIPGVRGCIGVVTDVIRYEDTLMVEVDYGLKKGDPANIFIDVVTTNNKNMETNNPIQFIDFNSYRGGNRISLTDRPNEAMIYSRTKKGKSYQIRLPLATIEAVQNGYVFAKLAVNNLTNETFLVFDRSEGLHIVFKTKNTPVISNRQFVVWLESRFSLPKNGGGRLVFSENLSRNGGYTYRIEASKD